MIGVAIAARIASCPACGAAVDDRGGTADGALVVALAAAPLVIGALVALAIVRTVRGRK